MIREPLTLATIAKARELGSLPLSPEFLRHWTGVSFPSQELLDRLAAEGLEIVANAGYGGGYVVRPIQAAMVAGQEELFR